MALKRTELSRLKAATLTDRLNRERVPDRFGKGSALVSRKQQRELDKARGLVPFAVKLNGGLVKRLREKAEAEKRPLDEVVAEALEKGLRA